jgi:rare lipoprotein A
VEVTVNDRGPYGRGRVLDLSTAAARAVGLTSAGIGRVTAEVIFPEE